MAHHIWTKTQKKEIYRLAKKGMKYDEIAEKYGVSQGAIAGQVHWYRKELDKEKKSRLRKKLYQKKKELKSQENVENLLSSELTQGFMFRVKRGRPGKGFPAIQGEENLEMLVSKIFVEGSDFLKIMSEKNLQTSDLKRRIQLDIEKHKQIVDELVQRYNEKDFGEATLQLARKCVFVDKNICKYLLSYDAEKHKILVERANNARKARKPKGETIKKYEKRASVRKADMPKVSYSKTKQVFEGVNPNDLNELLSTIDNFEKSFRKAVNLLKHLSDMSWVQRANAKPLIDAALEDLEK